MLKDFGRVVFIATFISYFLAGCATTTTPINWQDDSQLLVVTISSQPSDAAVYGIQGSIAGEFLGRTPLTLKYYYSSYGFTTTTDNILCWKGDYRQTIKTEYEDGFLKNKKSIVWFECFVVKDGYETYHIKGSVYGRIKGVNILKPFATISHYGEGFKGNRKNFTAILTSKVVAPQPQPQPQQQQQQQQTVVIGPGGSVTAEAFGTILLSSDVEDAEVYVDGMFVGNAPSNLKLKAGVHVIEVRSSGYPSYRKEIRVLENSEVSIRAKLKP